MLQGDGRNAAAARCGISINAARTHLMRIFEKTGVNRQAELIKVLLDPTDRSVSPPSGSYSANTRTTALRRRMLVSS